MSCRSAAAPDVRMRAQLVPETWGGRSRASGAQCARARDPGGTTRTSFRARIRGSHSLSSTRSNRERAGDDNPLLSSFGRLRDRQPPWRSTPRCTGGWGRCTSSTREPAPSVTRSGRVMLDEQTSMDLRTPGAAVASPVLSGRPPTGRVPSNTQIIHLRGGPNPACHAQRRPVPRDPRPIDPLARPETRAERPSRSPGPRDSPPDPPPRGARASSSLSVSFPSVPPDRLSRDSASSSPISAPSEACPPPRSTPSSPANPPSRECTTGTSSVPCSAPSASPSRRRQGAVVATATSCPASSPGFTSAPSAIYP